MMSNTFGAPLGGTTVIGQNGFESLALSLITPPNFGGGGGSCLPSMVVVALGEPGTPVICRAGTCGSGAAGAVGSGAARAGGSGATRAPTVPVPTASPVSPTVFTKSRRVNPVP